jgi:hypothetical protein
MRYSNFTPILILLVLFAISPVQGQRSKAASPARTRQGGTPSGCLPYEPAVSTLTGKIIRKTFAGRPNFESVKKGDEPETYWIIRLARPVCVGGGGGEPDTDRNVLQMQLVFRDGHEYRHYRRLLGTRVVASGTLFHGESGHHHTNILLTVAKLNRVH